MSNNENISYDNVGKKTIRELTNIDNYSSWNKFNDNWFMDSSEDISRIPVIKDTNFQFKRGPATISKNISIPIKVIILSKTVVLPSL